MNKPTYQTFTIDVSAAVAAGIPVLQPVQVIPGGRAVSSIMVRIISPVSQQINLHFGQGGDPMPVYQGEVFWDDHYGPAYDAPLFWSYQGAPAAGTSLVLTLFFAPSAINQAST